VFLGVTSSNAGSLPLKLCFYEEFLLKGVKA